MAEQFRHEHSENSVLRNLSESVQGVSDEIADQPLQHASDNFKKAQSFLAPGKSASPEEIQKACGRLANATEAAKKAEMLFEETRGGLQDYLGQLGFGAAAIEYKKPISPLDDPEAQLPPPSPGEVYSKCLEDVAAIVNDIRQRIESGVVSQAETIDFMIVPLVQYAVAAGRTGQAEDYLALMANCKNPTHLAKACFDVGTPRAFQILHKALADERQKKVEQYLAPERPPGNDILSLLQSLMPDVLHTVVIECRNRGLSSTEWIDTYAINRQDVWRQRIGHYVPQTVLSKPFQGEQTDLEPIMRDMLADPALDESDKRKLLRASIPYVKDIMLQCTLLDQYMAASPGSPVDYEDLRQHAVLGLRLLKTSPEICTPGVNVFFETGIHRYIEQAMGAHDTKTIVSAITERLLWQIHKRTHDGMGAEDITAFVDDEVGATLKDYFNDADGQPDDKKQNVWLTGIDMILKDEAVRRAEAGDMQGAAAFVKSMTIPYTKTGATEECFRYAKSEADIHLFVSDKDLAINPDETYRQQVALAKAMASGDAAAVASLTDALAAKLFSSKMANQPYIRYIEQGLAYLLRADRGRGIAIGRKILRSFENSKYDSVARYEIVSEQLIKAGDTTTAQDRFVYILSRKLSELGRLNSLYALARLLKTQQPKA